MRLAAQQVVEAWTRASCLAASERAVTALAVATGAAVRDVEGLPVGERNRQVLELFRANFGPTLAGCTGCPACAEALEFELDVAQLLGDARALGADATYRERRGTLSCRVRLPTTEDTLAAAQADSGAQASTLLLERCVADATRDGEAVTAADLTPDEVAWLGERLVASSPLSEISVSLRCTACEHTWSSRVDPWRFLWAELSHAAGRLLDAVHLIAGAYGWSEADVLTLPDARRRAYLERLGA